LVRLGCGVGAGASQIKVSRDNVSGLVGRGRRERAPTLNEFLTQQPGSTDGLRMDLQSPGDGAQAESFSQQRLGFDDVHRVDARPSEMPP
jgi:hypothetical protein